MQALEGRSDMVFMMRELTPYWSGALDCLAREWAEFGNFTVISGGLLGDDLHPWAHDEHPLQHASLHLIPPLKKWGTIWPSPSVKVALDRLDPSVVVIQEYSPYMILSGLAWAQAAGRPCVVASEVGPMQRYQFPWFQRLAHDIVNRSTAGILARTLDATDAARLIRKPYVLAPHAVATGFYEADHPLRSNPKRIIQVGSLIRRKGVDLLLAAMVQVCRYKPDAELVLVGAGDHASVRQQAKMLGIESSVTVIDFLQPAELIREYQRSDVFVLASRFDTYGVVVHEAAAAGLPLIISKHAGASATLVEEGVNGSRIDPEDAELFAEALLQALQPERNRRFSEASRKIAQRLDAQVVAERTASWLRQVTLSHAQNRGWDFGARLGTPYVGILRILWNYITQPWDWMIAWTVPDAFRSLRRDVVFINRHLPFYREGIFRKIMHWRRTLLLYSGKTLGNLKSVESVEHASVPFLESRRGGQRKIIWLGGTLRLLQARPRVVCTEMSLSLLSTWWWFVLRYLLGFGLVFWTHGFQDYGWRTNLLGWKDRVRLLWMRWADAVVFYSQDRREAVEQFTGKVPHFFVAPNTLDTQAYGDYMQVLEFEGRAEVRKRLAVFKPCMIYVGRLAAEKEVLGLAELLRTTAGGSQVPDLIVVGGGELESALHEACAPFAGRVRLLGPVFDPAQRCRWIYAADIMVCPGYAGLNVVDALALGCPFAAVHENSLIRRHSPEIAYVRHGENGIIAPSLPELGSALSRWFESGLGIALDRQSIRRTFLQESSIERQSEGLKSALRYAMGEINEHV